MTMTEIQSVDMAERKDIAMSPIKLTASVLGQTCDDDTIADILNALLSSEEDSLLPDSEAETAKELFDALCEARPDAVELARSL